MGRGFVELVENGILEGPEAEKTIKESLEPLLEAGADTIVLGCTHYPFLIAPIRKIAGPGVSIIDPAPSVARHLKNVMEQEGLLKNDGAPGKDPDIELYSSGDRESLERIFNLIYL